MESFNLNIIPGKDRPVCHASQYDIGRTIHVNLFEGFNVFTLDGTEVISISVRKPDGNVVTESVTNTSDSYVEFVTTEQMTACHGSNLCELKLEKGADVIGTMNFILEVEQDPLEGGVQSASEIDNLQTQIAGMVATEVADQYDSANVIFDATPTAGHGVGYAVTSEGVLNALGSLQTTLEGEIGTAVDTVEDIIGDAYDENNTYNTGDYCIYSDVLYKCNDDNVTGAWDATKWDATTVADELALKQNATDGNLQTTDTTVVGAINELKGGIDELKTNVYNNYNGSVAYILGDIVQFNGSVYKCIQTPPSAGYSPTGSPQYWDNKNISAQLGSLQRCMSIRETFAANTSITDAIDSIITKYGKNSMMGGFIITGYGFVHFSLSFSDDGQGGGYVVANNKGTGGNTPAMYIIQYVNGVVTLGYT